MVNRIKKLFYIAFQYKARLGVVFTGLADHCFKSKHAFMIPFVCPTRKRILNECRLKNRIQNFENRMMKYPVPNRSFVYVAHLGIANIKIAIRPVFVFLGFQIPMKLKNMLLQFKFKMLDILFFLFVFIKFIPRRKQIIRGNYFLKNVAVAFHT